MPLNFLLGVLTYAWELIVVQIINFEVLWTVLPVYICWFFTLFITKGREYEDVANTFLNGFSVFWVALDVGKYLIEGWYEVPYPLLKFMIVIGLIVYGFFVMRLSFQGKDIRRYIARIGEVSVINIATILFIQDLLPLFNTAIELLELVIGFTILYGSIDLIIAMVIKRFWVKRGVKEEAPAEAVPRIKRVMPPTGTEPPTGTMPPAEEEVGPAEETIPPAETEAVEEEAPAEEEPYVPPLPPIGEAPGEETTEPTEGGA